MSIVWLKDQDRGDKDLFWYHRYDTETNLYGAGFIENVIRLCLEHGNWSSKDDQMVTDKAEVVLLEEFFK